MKRLLSAAMLSMFSLALLAGCEASAEVGDDDDVEIDRRETTYKKTTTVRDDDGDVTHKTEIRRD